MKCQYQQHQKKRTSPTEQNHSSISRSIPRRSSHRNTIRSSSLRKINTSISTPKNIHINNNNYNQNTKIFTTHTISNTSIISNYNKNHFHTSSFISPETSTNSSNISSRFQNSDKNVEIRKNNTLYKQNSGKEVVHKTNRMFRNKHSSAVFSISNMPFSATTTQQLPKESDGTSSSTSSTTNATTTTTSATVPKIKQTSGIDRNSLSRGEHVEVLTFKDSLKKLTPYIWPKGKPAIKARVVAALSCLIISKLLNVSVPVLFKGAIDSLTGNIPSFETKKSILQQQQQQQQQQQTITETTSNITSTLSTTTNTPPQQQQHHSNDHLLEEFLTFLQNPDTLHIATTQLPFALILAWGGVRVISNFTNEFKNTLFTRIMNIATTSLATDLLRHLLYMDLSFHFDRNTGALSNAINRGTKSIGLTLHMLTFRTLPTCFEMLLVLGVLFSQCGPTYSGVALATLTSYIAFTIAITKWRIKFKQAMNKASNASNSIVFDSLMNVDTVQKFNNQEVETNKYEQCWKTYGDAQVKQESSLALLNWGQSTIFSIGLTAVMLLAVNDVQNGSMTVGDLVMVNGLLLQLAMPLNIVGSVYRELKQGVLDMQTMFALRQTKSQITNAENCIDFNQRLLQQHEQEEIDAKDIKDTNEEQENISDNKYEQNVQNIKQNDEDITHSTTTIDQHKQYKSHTGFPISLKNVSFSYPSSPEKMILNDITVDIPAGSSVAFVGGSGCGKSTLLKLASRQFDVTSGEIFIDNVPIKNIELNSLRNTIGIIPQETTLFNDSIYYNIHYAKLSATKNDVYLAAKRAHIHNNIMSMKDGYDTIVGERGVKLSGGEKQRISCARMMLVNPPIVFCDEATSSLDSTTEFEIMQNLRTLTTNKTCLYVAHRLSTITHCDNIFVLEQGRIVEQGTHDELLQMKNGIYSKMWTLQSTVEYNNINSDIINKIKL